MESGGGFFAYGGPRRPLAEPARMSDDPLPSRIPTNELNTLIMSVAEALDLAAAGEVLNGWRCLLGGMERAQEAEEWGDPWGPELVARYRKALDEYGELHGIRVE